MMFRTPSEEISEDEANETKESNTTAPDHTLKQNKFLFSHH